MARKTGKSTEVIKASSETKIHPRECSNQSEAERKARAVCLRNRHAGSQKSEGNSRVCISRRMAGEHRASPQPDKCVKRKAALKHNPLAEAKGLAEIPCHRSRSGKLANTITSSSMIALETSS